MNTAVVGSNTPSRRWQWVRSYGQELVVLSGIIVLMIVVGLYNPRFLSDNNLISIFSGNDYIAVAAIGMSIVIMSGHIDVSVGSLIGLSVFLRRDQKVRRGHFLHESDADVGLTKAP